MNARRDFGWDYPLLTFISFSLRVCPLTNTMMQAGSKEPICVAFSFSIGTQHKIGEPFRKRVLPGNLQQRGRVLTVALLSIPLVSSFQGYDFNPVLQRIPRNWYLSGVMGFCKCLARTPWLRQKEQAPVDPLPSAFILSSRPLFRRWSKPESASLSQGGCHSLTDQKRR